MMKYVQTIWQINPAQPAVHRGSWMGNLITTLEAKFPISCSFVVLPEHRQRVLNWLQAEAVGPHSVKGLPDNRIAVALGDRHDTARLREHHRHCLDQDVIVANRSAEQVNGFIRQMKRGLAS
jgi:hypothetical protein